MNDSAANGQAARSLGCRRADTLPRSGLLLDARFATRELASDATGVLPVAVVGAGAQATAHLIPALLQLPRVALVAVCDADGARAAAVAARFWIPAAFEQVSELLDAVKVAALVIACPPRIQEDTDHRTCDSLPHLRGPVSGGRWGCDHTTAGDGAPPARV